MAVFRGILSRIVGAAAMVVMGLAIQVPAAQALTCNGDTQDHCRSGSCSEREPVHASLSVDDRAKAVSLCEGSACYEARVVAVKSATGLSFAFDGVRVQPGEPRRSSALVTIHPGGKSATIGRFDADGSVRFSRLSCQ